MGRTDSRGQIDPDSPVLRFFHPVLASRALKREPVQVWVADQAFVLWRDAEGRPRAFVDVCPHRFAPLSSGRVRADGRLECPYHGWHFGPDGAGDSPSQPGLKGCEAHVVQVIERHRTLWIAGEGVDEAGFPDLECEGYTFAGAFSMAFDAPLHVALDNFSEDEHTPWVHTRLGWSAPDVDTVGFETGHDAHSTHVTYQGRQRRTLLRTVLGVKVGDTFHNAWTTRFDPVRTRYDIHWTDTDSGEIRPIDTRSTIFMVPETPSTTRFHVLVHVRVRKRRLKPLIRLVGKAAVALAWWEIRDDARFIRTVADTPTSMRGMRLGRFDVPLVHNRRLLDRIYWGR